MHKRIIALIAALSLALTFTGCSSNKASNKGNEANDSITNVAVEDDYAGIGEIDATITLGDNITVEGPGATADANKVTISSAGVYSVSGTLSDGQIIVDTEDAENVYLLLNGVNITCSNSSPIYIKSAKNAILVLSDNSENIITDGEDYVYEDETKEEPDAAIFSKDDLTIRGNGSLTVAGNHKNGITSKDDFKITHGNINITSTDDGIKGRDSITIKGGNITVNAGGDGFKSNNDEDETKGYISLEGGTINITAAQDGIQAETDLTVAAGDITINSGGGSVNGSSNTSNTVPGGWGNWNGGSTSGTDMPTPPTGNKGSDATTGASPKGDDTLIPPTGAPGASIDDPSAKDNPDTAPLAPGTAPMDPNATTTEDSESVSAKGLKATKALAINGGTITIDSSDDSIHSNDAVVINGGTLNLTSGDDGIHGDTSLDINGGDILISKSYEGIESTKITINEGNIDITASDDGVNAAGGNDGSSINGRPGQNAFSGSTGALNINGGYLKVNADGDGLDANGPIEMSSGTVLVNGPTNNGNGALDYDGTFNISGGILIAAGSAGMAQSPSTSSSQYSLSIGVGTLEANTLIHIEDEDGSEILTFAPTKTYQTVIVSSPNIVKGKTYKVYSGGSSTGTENNGLYTGGSYTPGNEVGSATLSNSVTAIGTASGGMNPGGKPMENDGSMKVPGGKKN